MYISSLVKVFGGFLFLSGSAVIIGGLWLKDTMESIPIGPIDDCLYIYAISESITDQEATPINIYDKNYLCKFSQKYYECTISAVKDFDPNIKHMDIKELKTNKKNHTINNNSLKQAGFIYRININISIARLMGKGKKIEIVKNSWDNQKKFASFKFLFSLNSDDSVNDNTPTQFFVVNTENAIISASAKNWYCKPAPSKKEKHLGHTRMCKIYEFSDQKINNNSLSDLPFKTSSKDVNASISDNKYYLVDLKPRVIKSSWCKYIELFGNNVYKSPTIFEFDNNVMPAIYFEDKPDHMFILGKS